MELFFSWCSCCLLIELKNLWLILHVPCQFWPWICKDDSLTVRKLSPDYGVGAGLKGCMVARLFLPFGNCGRRKWLLFLPSNHVYLLIKCLLHLQLCLPSLGSGNSPSGCVTGGERGPRGGGPEGLKGGLGSDWGAGGGHRWWGAVQVHKKTGIICANLGRSGTLLST